MVCRPWKCELRSFLLPAGLICRAGFLHLVLYVSLHKQHDYHGYGPKVEGEYSPQWQVTGGNAVEARSTLAVRDPRWNCRQVCSLCLVRVSLL